jgi:hypothetical protein
VLAAFVLLGMTAGGWVVSTRPARPSLLIAAVVGLVAVALVEALGVARRSVAGGDVAWGGVAAVVAFGVVLAVVGGALGRRTVGRSQPAAPPAARTRP